MIIICQLIFFEINQRGSNGYPVLMTGAFGATGFTLYL